VATLLSVNLGTARHNPAERGGLTGIDKRPTTGPVPVSAPPARGVGGLTGDTVASEAHHGGPDQAVYAYAREDLDDWAADLGRPLHNGIFGENLTTSGMDVTGALIGERWRVGDTVVLEVSAPRIPCDTFARWMAEEGWVTRFTRKARPGAYLRVVTRGAVRAGDPVVRLSRPDHDVTVALTFRALTLEPELLPRVLAAAALAEKHRAVIARRIGESRT